MFITLHYIADLPCFADHFSAQAAGCGRDPPSQLWQRACPAVSLSLSLAMQFEVWLEAREAQLKPKTH